MNETINKLKKEFINSPDLIIKEIKLKFFNKAYIVFLETVSSSDKVHDYILKNIILKNNHITSNNIKNFIAGPNTKEITNYDECEFYLTNGFTLLITNKNIYAVETKADINRSITESNTESSIEGPKDSFTENIQINLGLIKRRLKSDTLKTINTTIGRKTKTNISILYFEDIVDINNVKNIQSKIKAIDIDGIVDSSQISYLLDGESKSVYPTIIHTERPDITANYLLEGKIAILVDTSPSVLIIPSFFIDFINPPIDNYSKSQNVNFIKILRIFTFLISMMAPAIYIAIMNFNQETIPTSLLINFAIQREGVPFPTIIETILMLIICDILRESDLRFPSSYGSTISILGAIVLGEASVNAGVVSPITIIIVAITFITSLSFSNIEINNALRYFRYVFIASAGFFGLYGITLAFLYFLIYTIDTKSLSWPYFAPIAPFDKIYFNNSVIKEPLRIQKYRSKLLTRKNITKEKENV